jgi:ferric-dicitrate binding protein FerR (iron transport regulator)
MNIPESIENIVERTLRGEESPLERQQLEEWLQASPEHEKLYRERIKTRYLGSYSLKWDNISIENAWGKIMARYTRRVRRARLRFAAAASLVMLAGFYFLYTFLSSPERAPLAARIPPGEFKAILTLSDGRQMLLNKEEEKINDAWVQIHNASGSLNYHPDTAGSARAPLFHEITIPVGGEFHVTLSDGTFIYLNAASRLRFPVHFVPGSPREVALEGEGYFDVKRDSTSPFIVHAKEFDIHVLGTSFNAMAYEDDARAEITLVQGKVSVRAGEEEWQLLPSQQLLMEWQTGHRAIKQISRVDAHVNWKNGILDFDAMPLEELVVKLSRWYDVEFFFPDKRLGKLLFTGSVRKYENIDYILDLIGATTDVSFEINGKMITVNEK